MNLFKSVFQKPIFAGALLISFACTVSNAQNDQDKGNKHSRDSGQSGKSYSNGSGRQYDSGSQSSPGYRGNAYGKGDNSSTYSGRDSRNREDSYSSGQKNDYSTDKSDKSAGQKGSSSAERFDKTESGSRNLDQGKGSTTKNADTFRNNDKRNFDKNSNDRVTSDRSGTDRTNPHQGSTERNKPAAQPTLHTKQVANGEERRTASGQLREKVEKKSDGEHTKQYSATGRVQKEVIQKPNGTRETVQYGANGKIQKNVVVSRDGARETTSVHYGRGGTERATETIKVDARGREVSKTVIVKQPTVIIKNTTIVHNTTIVRNYDRAKFGFVYRPVYVVNAPVFVSWYDPFWWGPRGVWIPHPFYYHWGWDDYGWYRWHHHYWDCYDVYPTPAYWMTDWLIAGYVADRYADSVSVEQAREDARQAREDAERAADAAQHAREDAEIAEARAAQSEAEARAAKAEALAARLQNEQARAKSGDQPNPNATPIDPATKEALRVQVEKAVAEKKAYADEVAKGGNPVPPDVTKCLRDPSHIYPVSSSINVISAKDQSPAGTLTEGDLLKLEPGQESALKNADENTFVTMRVMTSKGDDGEAKAGTLVMVTLKNLQDFDSEFRAKLDLGLAEADKNKDQFKKDAVKAGG